MTARLVGWVPANGRVDVALGDVVRIGATTENDVVIPVDGVSRAHAQIVKQGDGYRVEDIDSRNGTWVNGERIATRTLRHLDVITLGRHADVVFVDSKRATAATPGAGIAVRLEWTAGPSSGRRVDVPRGESLVGRAPACQVVIDDLGVSRVQARFIVTGSTVTLEDLGSINGTFVDGQRITTPTTLAVGAVVGFGEPGGYRVVIEGTPIAAPASSARAYVAPLPPDMEWRTRIVWTSDELDAEPLGPQRPAVRRDRRDGADLAAGATAPVPPAMTAERARAVGEATELKAPPTELVPRPAGLTAFEPVGESGESAPGTVLGPPSLPTPVFDVGDKATPRTVLAPPTLSTPLLAAGDDVGDPATPRTVLAPLTLSTPVLAAGDDPGDPATPRTVLAPPTLSTPVLATGDDAIPRTQPDQSVKGPGVVPQDLAQGGTELPPETVLGFREVGPPPRLQTTAGGRPVAPMDGTMTPERPSATNIEARVRRAAIHAVTLTGETGVFTLARGTATIGRSVSATVRIDSQDISRIHAVLVVTDQTVTIEDRGSVNGTAVNGARISGSRPLLQGDRVSVADLEFRVDFKRLEDTE